MRAMNIGRLGVAMAALAAIALRAPAEPAAAPPPAARTIIPKPADIAASWKFPWDEIPGMTEANWRGQFHHDPRSDIRETCSLLQQMSDDDFSKLSAKMALPGGLGAALAPPTEGGTSQPATRPSRQAVVGALRELIDGTLDFAENDYSRSAPRPGAKPDAPADTDDDQLNIKIVIYSTPAIAGNFDLNADALTRVVNGMYEVERAGQENTKDSLQDLARQYNTEAEVGADVESRRGTLIAILNVTTDQTQLEGQTLDIGDNAYLWWTAKRNCTRRRIAITAQVRRGRAVATVSRTAVGPWADAAVEETRALLADLAGRLGPYGNAGAHAEGPVLREEGLLSRNWPLSTPGRIGALFFHQRLSPFLLLGAGQRFGVAKQFCRNPTSRRHDLLPCRGDGGPWRTTRILRLGNNRVHHISIGKREGDAFGWNWCNSCAVR